MYEVIADSPIASMFIIFIWYIKVSLSASRFLIIIIFVFENVVDIYVVLSILVVFNTRLIVVIGGFRFLVFLINFKGHHGCLSDLLLTNASYRCNRPLFRLLLAFLLFRHLKLCVVVFLLLLGFLLNVPTIFFIVAVAVVLDVATIVYLYWLGVYYRKRLFAVVLELTLALTLPTPLLMFFIC